MKFKLNAHLIYLTIIVGLIAGIAQLYFSFKVEPAWQEYQARKVSVFYNQQTEANKLVIDQIHNADKFVYFAIYTFTRTDIKDALIAANMRGLEVKGIIDREQSKKIDEQRQIVQDLQQAGVEIGFQDHSAIMHLKTLVTEKAYVSGSFNWTASATNLNDEVLEIGQDEDIRKQYLRVLEELFRRYPPQ